MSRVLIVDNDASMRQMLELAFRSQGVAAEATGCPEMARRALAGGGVAAMLLDYHLGAGVSGAVLLERWQRDGQLPPFWLVTGVPDKAEVEAAATHPACQGIVAKPFQVMALVNAVRAVLPASEQEA